MHPSGMTNTERDNGRGHQNGHKKNTGPVGPVKEKK